MTTQVIPSGTSTSQAADASITSEVIDTDNKGLRIGTMGFQVNSVGFNAADATVKIQASNTLTAGDFIDVTDGSITIATGTAVANLTPIIYLAMRYYRIVYTKVSNTAGTIKVTVNML